MASSSTASGINTNYEGITSNNNDMKQSKNSTSNDNDIEEGMNSTSDDKDIISGVTLFVAYDGKWEYDAKEWFFRNSKCSVMVVPKNVTLSEITNILYKYLSVNKELYHLKLEVHYRTGSLWFPVIEIRNNQELSLFFSETLKTRLPLCVTRLKYDLPNVVQDKFRSDAAEVSQKVNRAEKKLLKAIRKGDWVKARGIVNTKEVTWTSKLNVAGFTALHYAVEENKDNEVVRDILMGINSELFRTTVNIHGQNPVHRAALVGNTEALKIMLESHPECLYIPDNLNFLPIQCALMIPAIKTFRYLFKEMKSHKLEYDNVLRGMHGYLLLGKVIDTDLIDVAYELINDNPSMSTKLCAGITPLEKIIRKPDLFYSETHYNLCQGFFYRHVPIENNNLGSTDTEDIETSNLGSTDTTDVENQETPKKDMSTKHTRRCIYDVISRICVKLWETTLMHVPHVKHLKDAKVKHNTTIKLLKQICKELDRTHTLSDIERLYSSPFCLAVENNTAEAIEVLITYFARLYVSKKDGHNICQMIVLNRSEKVYINILHHQRDARSGFLVSKDEDDNNILHLAGRLAPIHKLNAVSGAALQMQRELQWFEEVKKLVGITHTRELKKNKETPMMVFRKEHKELRKDGEEWMKKTADSYTITVALIITIVFAAAITVPGGNDSATGKPIYRTEASLIIFAISDAISLFTSTTSLLLFLSILTARYADEDFLYKLPKRLILGLTMLFLSVTFMMIAFSSTLYIMFGQEKQWILIPIAALACLPIASFVTLQFLLLVELISSTYGPGMFAEEKNYWQSSANANKKKSV